MQIKTLITTDNNCFDTDCHAFGQESINSFHLFCDMHNGVQTFTTEQGMCIETFFVYDKSSEYVYYINYKYSLTQKL